MVKCPQFINKVAGYSLFELLLILMLLQSSFWFLWPKVHEMHLRWQARHVSRQVQQMMEYARWTSTMKHMRLNVIFQDGYLKLTNQNQKVLLSSTRIPGAIQLQWHGFQKTLPLIFESELSEQHVNGSWHILIQGKIYCRYMMNRLGHGHYVDA